MKTKTIQIDDDVAAVLRRCTLGATSVTLPPGQLDRKLYERVNKVLVAQGGKWNRGVKAHVFEDDPRQTFAAVLAAGAVVDEKATYQVFYTPDALADSMVGAVGLRDGEYVLEPSAGDGALVRAVRRRPLSVKIHAVELRSKKYALLDAGATSVDLGDFLALEPARTYNVVLMNPPFTGGQDMAHVRHAFDFLKPGGRLLSVMAPGWRTGTTKAVQAFREFVRAAGGSPDWTSWEDLPDGTFAESGTQVRTGLLFLRRGAA